MRRSRRLPPALLTFALLASLLPASPASAASYTGDNSSAQCRSDEFLSDELLVKFDHEVTDSEALALIAAKGASRKYKIAPIGVYVVKLPFGTGPREKALEFLQSGHVEYAEPNYRVRSEATPNDPLYSSGKLWGLNKIEAPAAWDVQKGSISVVVAVSDSGVDLTHADISGRIWANPGETGTDSRGRDRRTNGVDDDGNGRIDDYRGWDFANGDNNPTDDYGHGTHVAGTIGAATDNGVGIPGVAWNTRIMPLKFLDAYGDGVDSDACDSIVYAADKGAKVINCSWTGYFSQAQQDAIDYATSKGVLVVAAAGNDGMDAAGFSPAGCANVLTVAATDANDLRASWSNYGPCVEVAAPGVNITSLQAAGTQQGTVVSPGYVTMSGTSMAAPHVSGVAALLFAQHSDWSNKQVMAQISSTADALSDTRLGNGRLNAYSALTRTGSASIGLKSADVADADGNGILEAAESAGINVVLSNAGVDARSVHATLRTSDPYVTVTTSDGSVGDMPAAGTAACGDFRVGVSSAAPDGHVVPFTLDISANDGQYTNTLSFQKTIASPPAAPAGLAIDFSNGVTLSWRANAEPDLAGYNVYRSKTSGYGYARVNTAIVTGTTYRDTGALAGTTYYYVVKAVDTGGTESGASGEVCSLVDSSAPTTPGSLTLTAQSAQSISLRWGTSSDNVGVKEYRIERSLNGSTWSQVGIAATTSYTDTGLKPYTKYYYRVRACDAAGNLSGYCRSAYTYTLKDSMPPTAPGTLAATAVGGMSVSLGWSAATDNVGVKEYRIERSTNGSTFTQVGTTTGASYVAAGLMADTAYQFRVRAADLGGLTGPYSNAVSVRTRPLTRTEQSDSAVAYAGSWSTESGSSYSGGSQKTSSVTGNSASFGFSGTEIAWIGTKGSYYGKADVYLDGTRVATVDCYGSSAYKVSLWSASGLAAGSHTVKVVVTGTRSRSAKGSKIPVDAFDVGQ